MNAFLLACYICLQLTNVSELNQHAIIKRDNACEQCLTGIFDHSELMSQVGTQPDQSSGNLLASNPVLKEALEERLMLELSQSSLKSKLQPKGEPNNEVVIDHQLERAPVVTEETLKATEQAFRTMQEAVVNNIREASQEMLLQLRQQQVQLGREFELLAAKQRELMMKEMALAKETVKKTEEKPLVKNVLKSNAKLMAGESLVSENGRYKATLQKNGELVITDKYQEDRIVKKIGQAMRTPSDNVYMHLQQDGNLVIYSRLYQWNNFDYPIWQSGTSVRKAWYTGAKTMDGSDYHLKLEVNGQLVMYDGIGRQIWISGKLESRQKVILMPDLIEYI